MDTYSVHQLLILKLLIWTVINLLGALLLFFNSGEKLSLGLFSLLIVFSNVVLLPKPNETRKKKITVFFMVGFIVLFGGLFLSKYVFYALSDFMFDRIISVVWFSYALILGGIYFRTYFKSEMCSDSHS